MWNISEPQFSHGALVICHPETKMQTDDLMDLLTPDGLMVQNSKPGSEQTIATITICPHKEN